MSIYVKIIKSFGNFVLNTEFEAENEILALLGSSGSGKSMTLKCIAGIVKPDKGCVRPLRIYRPQKKTKDRRETRKGFKTLGCPLKERLKKN